MCPWNQVGDKEADHVAEGVPQVPAHPHALPPHLAPVRHTTPQPLQDRFPGQHPLILPCTGQQDRGGSDAVTAPRVDSKKPEASRAGVPCPSMPVSSSNPLMCARSLTECAFPYLSHSASCDSTHDAALPMDRRGSELFLWGSLRAGGGGAQPVWGKGREVTLSSSLSSSLGACRMMEGVPG